MATASETVSRWARGFVVASACWLVAWQAVALWGVPRRVEVSLALYGFVLHMVFGKAYSLVPSYFDRDLAFARAPAVHLPLAVLGAGGLAVGPLAGVPAVVVTVGAIAWAGGVALFLGTMLWTVRDNLTGSDTGTGEHNAHRRTVDRLSNAAVPAVLAYLSAGTYLTLASATPLPVPLDGYPPRASHLLAVGTATLLLFAVGFRLLPRFLVAEPPSALVWVVLPCGALGPLLLAVGLPAGPLLEVGGLLVATAVLGFAAAYVALFVRTDRDRIGFYGVLLGVLGGVATVALGLSFAFVGVSPALVTAHYRLALLGFLGVTIVGVTYQFYPPSVGQFPLAGERLAAAVYVGLAGGLVCQVAGIAADRALVATAGRVLTLAGALAYAYLLFGLFAQRRRQ